jgi:hypothetical protein
MSVSDDLRKICTAAEPLIERWLELSEEFAAFRTAATEKGLDWSQIKAILKARKLDELDGGDGKRVKKIIEKADCASEYADMLGLGNGRVNEKNFSAPPPKPVTAAPPREDEQSPRHRIASPPVATAVEHEGIPEFLVRS